MVMPSTTMKARDLREAGQEIREKRMNRGLSPEDLGRICDVSGRSIRRIEQGARPRVRTMFALASKLDFEVTDVWPA